MKIRVLYHSRGGSTKKVAEAIAQAVGVPSEAVPPAYPPENVGLLFIGTGVYFGKIDNKLKEFINTLNTSRVKNVAVFGTTGSQDVGIKMVQDLVRAKGINVVEDTFMCKGKSFIFINRKHPTADELNEAQKFAKCVVEKVQSKG